ncbi:HK97 gp10 family phage protein [Fusobacterium sp. HMSC073F01]|uniref:HK97 gp10 family phage protein n=1 Tax=Fusobacterium sp. HMSC073F01 TaxID=1739251 RepID=UPI0008A50A90|nr:HK97 gp10 family phage protein [Fusobacterium sp. HMSC073F01]OFL79100.1 hypothetical protein HMPREF2747_05645 [Fusobacterium sp. HMSC073F01]
MGNAVKINFKELENFSKQLEKLAEETRWVIVELANEIAARLLRKVIKRTPVGIYGKQIPVTKKIYRYEVIQDETTRNGKPKKRRIDTGRTKTVMQSTSGKTGGTLRRGWDIGPVIKSGETYSVKIFNSVEYASYVEFGHRTRNHKGWVQGHFMLTISEKELSENLNVIIEKKLTELFGERFR